MKIEELLEKPYWIIDILPKQVPTGGGGRYFAVEKYWRETQLAEVKEKHANLVLKLNCYCDISLDEEAEVNPSPAKVAEAVRTRYVNVITGDSLITSDPEDTYLTVFDPDEDLLELIRDLAAGISLA